MKDLRHKMTVAVQGLQGKRVMIVGDLMLDHYVVGRVSRISPEAPVPVVRVEEEKYLLGGAGNVAANILSLGGAPQVFGVAGEDERGRVLTALFDEARIPLELVSMSDRPTTVKTRIIAHNQQVVRVDRERTGSVPEHTCQALLEALAANMDGCPVVILSDYGKGVLSRAFMAGFWRIVERQPRRPLVLVDPKPSNYDLYEGVDLLTPNTKEAAEGAGVSLDETGTVDKAGVLRAGFGLFKRLRCRKLAVTLGPGGMALFESPDEVWHVPTFARKVFDVTGAGDTVIATLGLGLASGLDLLTAGVLANYAAGIVVGQVGAATTTAEEILDALRALPEPTITSWLAGN